MLCIFFLQVCRKIYHESEVTEDNPNCKEVVDTVCDQEDNDICHQVPRKKCQLVTEDVTKVTPKVVCNMEKVI